MKPFAASSRRTFLGRILPGAAGAAYFTTRGLFAEQLAATPRLTEGPYYPDKLPLDRDNDLVLINEHITPAIGEITHLSGRVLDSSGSPVNNALIEIWQADASGVYINSRSLHKERQDRNFQGYGTFLTASTGEYRFRTIKPVPYENRCPHIHVRVKQGDRELLTTQIFVNGDPMNARDGVFNGLRDPFDRELVLADFKPISGSKIGELAAHFDIVLGRTPADQHEERPGGSAMRRRAA